MIRVAEVYLTDVFELKTSGLVLLTLIKQPSVNRKCSRWPRWWNRKTPNRK